MTVFKGAAAAVFLMSTSLMAQERPAAILVMDGSGSMWGQIDGVAKITIAQQVMGELMTSLPTDLDLGLTVYGHRRKGDCADIETIVLPAPDTRAAITSAVNGISPKGKTPMADAVVTAAQALRYREEPATVILVSDGIETCVPDVCAVARELEASGVDFTAHVVGFDVDDPKARAQFQCMAEATGGQYLSANNADELGAALTQVAAAPPPPPEPAPTQTRIFVVEGPTHGLTRYDIAVQVFYASGTLVHNTDSADFTLRLPLGDYRAVVTRLKDEVSVDTAFKVIEGAPGETMLHLPEFTAPATLVAPESAPAGAAVEVTWTGPDEPQDYIDTALPDADGDSYLTYEYTNRGTPLSLRLPAQPGDYVIRYVLSLGTKVLATTPITVTERSFGLTAPDTAPIGETISIDWVGSGFNEDYITLAEPGSGADDYLTYEYVRKGTPLPFRLTMQPGAYELRYINGQDVSIAASRKITLTDVAFGLSVPATIKAGETVSVPFTGPAYSGDYITFVSPGADVLDYLGYAYTKHGNPAELTAPDTPGTYELRFISTFGEPRIMAAEKVTVE